MSWLNLASWIPCTEVEGPGKRAALWINDLMMDLEELEFELSNLKLLGCKGTTGTCASFLELFGGDEEKCLELERKIAASFGWR